MGMCRAIALENLDLLIVRVHRLILRLYGQSQRRGGVCLPRFLLVFFFFPESQLPEIKWRSPDATHVWCPTPDDKKFQFAYNHSNINQAHKIIFDEENCKISCDVNPCFLEVPH